MRRRRPSTQHLSHAPRAHADAPAGAVVSCVRQVFTEAQVAADKSKNQMWPESVVFKFPRLCAACCDHARSRGLAWIGWAARAAACDVAGCVAGAAARDRLAGGAIGCETAAQGM